MVGMPVDPMEPPKFKHKKVPRASGSPPEPVMHSPPRPVTVKDQQDWKIPPCISNGKNLKGYTIPLDKRMSADGRGLEEVRVNDNFAKISEALYVAEQKAREAVAMRCKVQREMAMKEKEKKELKLRELARKARAERTSSGDQLVIDREREECGEERRRERERETRMEEKKKRKIDGDRDVSEKVALGMAATTGRGGEVMYDQRLFNQEKGMESGFGNEDGYNVYDKGLFTAQPTLSTLCKPKKDMDDDMYGDAGEKLDKITKIDRFKPDKAFTGVEFDKEEVEEADPFGLDQFLTEVKKGKKAVDNVGSCGTMKATAGSMRDGFEGSCRSHIAFNKGRC